MRIAKLNLIPNLVITFWVLMAIRIDVVVVVIDRVRESVAFAHFVGMLLGSCFINSTNRGFWPAFLSQIHEQGF